MVVPQIKTVSVASCTPFPGQAKRDKRLEFLYYTFLNINSFTVLRWSDSDPETEEQMQTRDPSLGSNIRCSDSKHTDLNEIKFNCTQTHEDTQSLYILFPS